MPTGTADRDTVAEAVKRFVIAESRLSIGTGQVGEDERLTGPLLSVTSLGLLGMLLRLEDDLGVTLPDDLFAGPPPGTVRDLVDLVQRAAR
ncbi:acyl carrier protein [Actinoplanes oblitus]|uniref:Acyl carrier protein n=1 Tax=Actinoplanes oblitus TaxID=3040509 RepID=A0ABY8WS63_9ACTN|nr:acyl carrier protein [Actinoplanes oblitus]WIM99841.1 acyl carrier protein [Actinoplanes oblitus]